MKKNSKSVVVLALTFGAMAAVAHADPLIKMEEGKPKPSVVTAWKTEGKNVELTLKEGEDAQAVADAIKAEVGRVRTSVRDGKVVVVGKSEADLLKALANVEVGGDDFGALADAALSEESEGSGSSLRAKKVADLEKLFKNKDKLAMGTVASVSYGTYPMSTITMKVITAPKGALGKKIRRGATIKVRPALGLKGKDVDWSNDKTQTNAGAWYLKRKDRVRVLIEKEVSKGVYEASVIDRP